MNKETLDCRDFKVFQSYFGLFVWSSSSFKIRFLFLQYHLLQVHFSDFKIILIAFKTTIIKLFIELFPSLYCRHNLVFKPRFWVGFYSNHFWWGYEIYCSYKSIYKIWLSIFYTSIGQIVRETISGRISKTFRWNIFSMNEQKSHYVNTILVRMSFLCSKSGHDQ